jgi:outer membrane protein TolC
VIGKTVCRALAAMLVCWGSFATSQLNLPGTPAPQAPATETPLSIPSSGFPGTGQNAFGQNIFGQSAFEGSVPTGNVVPRVIPISLRDAIDRGLKYNLGLLLANESERNARGARYRALSDLLPNITTHVADTQEQVNLAAFGLPPIPGIPRIVGPFNVFDARAFATQPILNFKSLYNTRASSQNVQAAKYTAEDARDLVVLAVGAAYLLAIADEARINTAQAQLKTAQALYQQASDMLKAGVVASIDEIRSQVEMQVQQQRLLVAQNDYDKQMLSLARTIGLPIGQQFTLSDKMPFAPAPPITLDAALTRAYNSRADYRSAQALEHAAELARKDAVSERLPSLALNGDYGALGNQPGNAHGTFTATAALNFPIFQGGKVRGDILQADAVLAQRRAQTADLRGRIEYEVRSALLDLNAASEQVRVAQSSIQLAEQQVTQSRDRFAAGVADTVEVIQAQEALATTNQNFIASVFQHNLAKLSLARALGIAEEATKQFLGGK